MTKAIGTKQLTGRQRELIAQVVVDGNNVANFSGPQIPDWKALKTVMVALGGKWKSRVGFEFPDDVYAHEVLRLARETGEILDPKAADFFETPPELVESLCNWAELEKGMAVLEPSAGRGALALMAQEGYGCEVFCVEPFPANRTVLEKHGLQAFVGYDDFLTMPADPTYDRVIMNPPFGGRADIAHVTHAM